MRIKTIFLLALILMSLLGGMLAISGQIVRWHDSSPLNVYPITSTLSNDAIVPAPSFVFFYVEGHFEIGFNMLRIDGNGEAKYLVHVPIKNPRSIEQRLASFTLSEQELSDLGHALRDSNFANMPDGYSTGVVDGMYAGMHVLSQGKRKVVTCDDYFPPEFVALQGYLSQHILAPQQAVIDRAEPVSQQEIEQIFSPVP
ncbi:hypothetical protein DTL42_18665 [Bremerella cremea]|uniref:Uncharacterized protein n=1 Tax=Bremerella cremea TaxID=1031537 RepID=A0A368KMS5_9BACT|nr:hypothetical protein [Bremerella cremea]RCS44007.1 hypothetical protein DTL42_18665 [Bremerella cremea]